MTVFNDVLSSQLLCAILLALDGLKFIIRRSSQSRNFSRILKRKSLPNWSLHSFASMIFSQSTTPEIHQRSQKQNNLTFVTNLSKARCSLQIKNCIFHRFSFHTQKSLKWLPAQFFNHKAPSYNFDDRNCDRNFSLQNNFSVLDRSGTDGGGKLFHPSFWSKAFQQTISFRKICWQK